MTLLDEVENYFNTRILYDVIGVDKNASENDIKKAYRKTSLKIHPDRVGADEKETATKKFQILAQIHHILSDSERRKLYDDHGIIANDDSLESEADWFNYWRLLFPEISEKDVDNFMDSYIGSAEEEKDLIEFYNRFEGDLDMISNYHIGFDEEKTTEQLERLIEEGKIKSLPKFSQESSSKKAKRVKKAAREAKQAAKYKEEMKTKKNGKDGGSVESLDDLTAMIRRKQEGNYNNLMANLEAKYCKKPNGKGTKRKRT